MEYCDLHTHSTYSDDTFSPTQIVAEGLRKKLRAVALTDHNTIAGLPTFLKAAEGTGLEGIPGVEIFTGYRNNKMTIANPKVIAFMLAEAMWNDGNSYYVFNELYDFDVLFPYEYTVSKEHMLTDPHFTSTHFGGEMTMALKEQIT